MVDACCDSSVSRVEAVGDMVHHIWWGIMGGREYIDVGIRGFSALPALIMAKCGVLRWMWYICEVRVGPDPGCAQ